MRVMTKTISVSRDTVFETSLEWLKYNIASIPISKINKRPLIKWKKYQYVLPTKDKLEKWFFNKDVNIAIICGGRPKLTIIDFDDFGVYLNFVKDKRNDNSWKKIIETGYKVRSKRGVHIYVTTTNFQKTRNLNNVDIKGVGGYALVPPSSHKNGDFLYVEIPGHIYNVKNNLIDDIIDKYKKENISDFYDEYDEKFNKCLGTNTEEEYTLRDKINKEINILWLVSQYTNPYRTSSRRWWMAKCPNPSHVDNNPSFRIDTVYNNAKCLSGCCHLSKTMTPVNFYIFMTGVDYKQAIIDLSKMIIK